MEPPIFLTPQLCLVRKLRKPHTPVEDIIKGKKSPPTQINKAALVYSIEFLAHLAMSPLCLTQPKDWEQISKDYPYLIRNVSDFWRGLRVFLTICFQTVESFDAKQYLSIRTGEPTCVLSADEIDSSNDV